MIHSTYENKLNDVITKCPIEMGVEILVYNVLDSVINSDELSIIDINALHKDRDVRLTTDGGISDIAIVSKDFVYQSKSGQAYGFIEVKAPYKPLPETLQINSQKDSENTHHFLYTNGVVWKYYCNSNKQWTIHLDDKERTALYSPATISVSETQFSNLITELEKINWKGK